MKRINPTLQVDEVPFNFRLRETGPMIIRYFLPSKVTEAVKKMQIQFN